MAGMVTEKEILDYNPWWEDAESINADEKIRSWEESKMGFVPGLANQFRYDTPPGSHVIYTLRGPRQVGKTTIIKLQIQKFLREGVPPWNILYYSLDLAKGGADIVRLVELYMKMAGRRRRGRCHLFLDEASAIKDWGTGIKVIVDRGMVNDCTVVVSGSDALNLERARNRLVGRMGDIRDDDYADKILLPMRFSEYAPLLDGRIGDAAGGIGPPDKRRILSELLEGRIDPAVGKLYAGMNRLNDALGEYMLTGGFPHVLHEKITAGTISAKKYSDYLQSMIGSWGRVSRNADKVRSLCGELAKIQAGSISEANLARESRLGSHNTVHGYLSMLDGLSVLTMVYRYNARTKAKMFRKSAKAYFQDPFLFHVFNNPEEDPGFKPSMKFMEAEENAGRMVEGVVASHLIRRSFDNAANRQTFDHTNHVFYWQGKKGREVDFVLSGGGAEAPIEVKYRNQIRRDDLRGMTSFLNASGARRGLVISKDAMEERGDCLVIPASVFLMLV